MFRRLGANKLCVLRKWRGSLGVAALLTLVVLLTTQCPLLMDIGNDDGGGGNNGSCNICNTQIWNNPHTYLTEAAYYVLNCSSSRAYYQYDHPDWPGSDWSIEFGLNPGQWHYYTSLGQPLPHRFSVRWIGANGQPGPASTLSVGANQAGYFWKCPNGGKAEQSPADEQDMPDSSDCSWAEVGPPRDSSDMMP